MSKILYLTLSFGVLSCSTAMAMQNNNDAFERLGRRLNSQAGQFAALEQRMNSAAGQAQFRALGQRMGAVGQAQFGALDHGMNGAARQAQFAPMDYGMNGAARQAQIENERRQAEERQLQIADSQRQAQLQAEERQRHAQIAESQRQVQIQADITRRQAEESQKQAQIAERPEEKSIVLTQENQSNNGTNTTTTILSLPRDVLNMILVMASEKISVDQYAKQQPYFTKIFGIDKIRANECEIKTVSYEENMYDFVGARTTTVTTHTMDTNKVIKPLTLQEVLSFADSKDTIFTKTKGMITNKGKTGVAVQTNSTSGYKDVSRYGDLVEAFKSLYFGFPAYQKNCEQRDGIDVCLLRVCKAWKQNIDQFHPKKMISKK